MQSAPNWVNLTDEELVGQAQNGSHGAFGELVRRHRGGCMKLSLSILRNKQDAEDEVQNAFWKAFQNISRFHGEAKFGTWLTRIVTNQCLMKVRRDRRAKFLYIDDVQIGEDAGTLDLPAPEDTPEQGLGKEEVARVFRDEVRRVPPVLRNAFVLREFQRLPIPEVAQQLGVSVPAAKSRLLRARAELRRRLVKHQGRTGRATLLAC